MIDLNMVVEEIKEGLPCDRNRRERARINLDYYRGEFDEHRFRMPDARTRKDRNERTSLVMQRAIDTSTAFMYRDNPVRTIKRHDAATDWLQKVYKSNGMLDKWQEADRLTWIADAAAWQVAGTDDEDNPIKINVFPAHAFTVFCSEDDPTLVEAVVLIDKKGKRDRYTLWTAEIVQVYLSRKDGNGNSTIVLESEEPNLYEVLPFAFAHYKTPVIDFWTGSPGTTLREVNDYAIYRLTELGDAIKYVLYPKLVGMNLPAGWKPPTPWLPGDIAVIPRGEIGENNTPATIAELSPPIEFIEKAWVDINNYIDHTLEMVGIPEASFRFTASAGRSGQSIQTEQLPLLNAARKRQKPFLEYETALAKLVLQVAVKHLDNHGISLPEPELREALDDFELTLRWPQYHSAIPGPERDRADAYAIANGYASRIQVLEEREGLTHEEAIDRLRRVADDQAVEEEILGEMTPQPMPDPTPDAADQDLESEETDGN